MIHGPRDIFRDLSCLLASLSDKIPRLLNLLRARMAASNEPFNSVSRFIAVHDDSTASSESTGNGLAMWPQPPTTNLYPENV